MNFENLEGVAAYLALRDALHAGDRPFCIGMHCYFWGRLASFAIAAGSVAKAENDLQKSAVLALVHKARNIDPERFATEAEARALAVGEEPPNRLMSVGYWSNVCYFLRYLSSADSKWSAFSADSFLSALDDVDDEFGGQSQRNEMANLSAGFVVAQSMAEANLASAAETMFEWSSLSPVGTLLPPFPKRESGSGG